MLSFWQQKQAKIHGMTRAVIESCLPCETATELAEAIANKLGHPEWLDDDTHVVWDVAACWISGD